MKRTQAVAAALLAAAASICSASSVESVTVTTATWKRAESRVTFRPGRVVLALAFDKVMPAKPKPAKPDEGFEYEEPGPRITVEASYAKSPASGPSGSVAGLEGAVDASGWAEEPLLGAQAAETPPDAPLPTRRVLLARAGPVSYRLSGTAAPGELAPFLKAFLSGEPVLYRARRQDPAEVAVAGPKGRVVLYQAPAKPELFETPHPEQMPDLEYQAPPKAPVVFQFRMRYDDLSFGKRTLAVASGPSKQVVRLLLRCAKIGLYADTDKAGIAEFDLGVRPAAEQWRYQPAKGSPAGSDALLAVGGRILIRLAGSKAEPRELAAPAASTPAGVAEALAAAAEHAIASGQTAPPELVTDLFGQPLEGHPALPWKADGCWLQQARRGKTGSVADTAGWLDGLLDETYSKWVTRRADRPASGGRSSWTEAQAERLLALMRQYELSGETPRLVEARKEAARILPLVLTHPDADETGGALVTAHAMLIMAFFKAYDVTRETSYRRMAFDQIAHLLEEHVGTDGSIRPAKGGAELGDVRTAGLVAQVLKRAWRSSSKPVYKNALLALRKRVLESWSSSAGGFTGAQAKGKPSSKAELSSQFWAMTVFADGFFPYWDLPSHGWFE